MKQRAFALWLACAAQALVLILPAAAQGLRIPPAAGPGRPAVRPADNSPQRADYIVAVVNSEPVTNHEVRLRMAQFGQQLAQQGQAVPAGPEFAREVLERLISEKAQLQLARENGIKVDEGAVDQAEQNVARQNQIDVAELRRRLAADRLSLSMFRDELRNQLMVTRLRERELDARVKVTDLEVDQYIRDRSTSNDLSALELNLAHILVAVPENATEAQIASLRERAQRLQQRARAGEDFIKLGREASEVPGSGVTGGVVGLRTADRYPPLFVQAVQAVPEGGVSDVVRSGAGLHVIKVIEKRRGGLPGAHVVQSHARHILLRPSAQLSESAARQRLADFKKRVEAGQADFAQLAREYSQDASAANGGDLGWAAPGLFVPEFENALNSLAPGQIADPVMTRFGMHLIQLLERRQATLTQREQREIARNLLREKKLDEAYVQWAQEVRGRAYVEFREPPS
jgi:peptidyl-prolyl cis-trans isomerase SurA